MPPRVATANTAGTGVGAWYQSLPPITRFYATAIVATTLICQLGLVSPYHVVLLWRPVISKLEVWRLVTSFFFAGKFSLNFVIQLIWLVTYGGTLESQTYQHEPAMYLLALVFGGLCMLAVSVPFGFVAFAKPMIFMMLYLWSRHFPEQQVSIYGLFKVMSFYVPFVFLALGFLLDGAVPWADMCGVLVGHLFYYLTVLYPAVGGPELLKPPRFMKNLLADRGVGTRVNTHAATGQNTFQAFRGSGMRLGTQ